MNLAIEYLIRKNLIKNWLNIPCSLFLFNKEIGRRLVITISEEFKKSDYYSVKYWHIDDCSKEQSLPPMNESQILKSELFTSPAIIMHDYSLLQYKEEYISSFHNSFNHPMSHELYVHFYEQIINGRLNDKTRMNWLWKQFIRVYSINLYSREYYISSVYCSENDLANEQRNIVYKNMKKEWQCWELWQKYLLLSPGEIFFYKEFSEQ